MVAIVKRGKIVGCFLGAWACSRPCLDGGRNYVDILNGDCINPVQGYCDPETATIKGGYLRARLYKGYRAYHAGLASKKFGHDMVEEPGY